jgi:hypothetical protein
LSETGNGQNVAWQMGDPYLAVSEESHDASEEATRHGDASNYQKVLLFPSQLFPIKLYFIF